MKACEQFLGRFDSHIHFFNECVKASRVYNHPTHPFYRFSEQLLVLQSAQESLKKLTGVWDSHYSFDMNYLIDVLHNKTGNYRFSYPSYLLLELLVEVYCG